MVSNHVAGVVIWRTSSKNFSLKSTYRQNRGRNDLLSQYGLVSTWSLAYEDDFWRFLRPIGEEIRWVTENRLGKWTIFGGRPMESRNSTPTVSFCLGLFVNIIGRCIGSLIHNSENGGPSTRWGWWWWSYPSSRWVSAPADFVVTIAHIQSCTKNPAFMGYQKGITRGDSQPSLSLQLLR